MNRYHRVVQVVELHRDTLRVCRVLKEDFRSEAEADVWIYDQTPCDDTVNHALMVRTIFDMVNDEAEK